MSLLPVLFNMPVVLLPAHIAFLELVIDPACSVVFEAEPEEDDIMKRPPRNLKTPLFNRSSFVASLLQGLSVLVASFAVFYGFLHYGFSENEARTLAFGTLVIANLAIILINLSSSLKSTLQGDNKTFWPVVVGTAIALTATITLPFLRDLFHFAPLLLTDVLLMMVVGVGSVLSVGMIGRMIRK